MFILPEKEYFHIGDVVVNSGTRCTIVPFNSMTTETWHFETKEEREVTFKKLVRIYTGKTTPEKEKE